MMLCVMMLPLVVVVAIKAVCRCARKPPPPPPAADDTEHSPQWQTPLNGIISPSEADPVQKQLEGTQKYINEQCR